MYWKERESELAVRSQVIHGGDGEIKRRHFFAQISKLPVNMETWELDPGASEGGHIHDGDESLEEIYYFLEGTGTMQISGDEVPVQAGDAVLAPKGVEHGFRNTGDETLRLVLIWGKPSI